MEHPGRRALRRIIGLPDPQIDLIEGALAVAQEDLDLADVQATRDLLARLASRAREQVGATQPTLDYAEQLVQYLHTVEGFRGNTSHYDDPANSYLPLVCEQRAGLPITLTLVMLAVARELELPIKPVALPGHVMAHWQLDDGAIFLDLFFGQVLDGRACRAFLQAQSGATLPDPDLFPPTTNRAMLVRLLTNLKQSYVRRANFSRALAATERILLLQPGTLEDVRDRGFLRLRVGDLHRGLYDLERYAAEQPTALDHVLIRKQARSVGDLLRGRS